MKADIHGKGDSLSREHHLIKTGHLHKWFSRVNYQGAQGPLQIWQKGTVLHIGLAEEPSDGVHVVVALQLCKMQLF